MDSTWSTETKRDDQFTEDGMLRYLKTEQILELAKDWFASITKQPGSSFKQIEHLVSVDMSMLNASDDEIRKCLRRRGYVVCENRHPLDDKSVASMRSQTDPVLRDYFEKELSYSELASTQEHFQVKGFTPVVSSHAENAKGKLLMPDGFLHKTVGKVVERKMLPTGSIISVVRFYDSPEGLAQCRRVESRQEVGGSMKTVRRGSEALNLEFSFCIEGKRPGTGLIGIIEYPEDRPVDGTSEPFTCDTQKEFDLMRQWRSSQLQSQQPQSSAQTETKTESVLTEEQKELLFAISNEMKPRQSKPRRKYIPSAEPPYPPVQTQLLDETVPDKELHKIFCHNLKDSDF